MITFLKKKDTQKDDEMSSLKETIRDLRQGLRQEWNKKEELFQNKIASLETELSRKDQEVGMDAYHIYKYITLQMDVYLNS